MPLNRDGDIVISSRMAWVGLGGLLAGLVVAGVAAAWNIGTTVALHTQRLDTAEHRIEAIEADRKAEQEVRFKP